MLTLDTAHRRRQFLKGSAGMAFAAPLSAKAALASPAQARPVSLFEPKTMAERLNYYMKASVSTADESVRWWMISDVFLGLPGQPLKPVFRTESISIVKCTPTAAGFRIVSHDRGYFADLKSGDRLESWTNPVTGETIVPPLYDDGVETTDIDQTSFANTPASKRPWTLRGDEANLMDDRLGYPQTAKHFSLLYSYSTSYKDLTDPAISSTSADIIIQFIMKSYLSWMKMNDRPGFLYARVYGTKSSATEVLDSEKLNRISALFPGVF